MTERLTEWVDEVSHKVKVMVTGSLSEERADIRPSQAYRIIAERLLEEADRLEKSVEKQRDGLAN